MTTIARRQFLNFLAASPLLAAAGYSRVLSGGRRHNPAAVFDSVSEHSAGRF